MSDRELARHRSTQRPVTFLTDAGDAVTGRIAVVGRTSAVLAASTGMLATGGLPASGSPAPSAPVSSTDASAAGARTILGGVSAGLFSGVSARSTRTRLSAPMTATVSFETSAFRAAPAPRRIVTPTKVAAVIRTVPARSATPAQAEPAHQAAAPPKRSKHVEAPKKERVEEPKKKHVEAPKRSKHVEAPKRKHVEAPKKKRHVARPPAKAPAGSVRGSSVLAIAARYIGTPYLYGGTSPRGFDCSGYVGYVYRQLGMSLPRTANQQMQDTRRVSRSQARPGDLVFFVSGSRAYHVGIYAGGGKMYDSPRSGKTVTKRAIWSAAVVFGRATR